MSGSRRSSGFHIGAQQVMPVGYARARNPDGARVRWSGGRPSMAVLRSCTATPTC